MQTSELTALTVWNFSDKPPLVCMNAWNVQTRKLWCSITFLSLSLSLNKSFLMLYMVCRAVALCVSVVVMFLCFKTARKNFFSWDNADLNPTANQDYLCGQRLIPPRHRPSLSSTNYLTHISEPRCCPGWFFRTMNMWTAVYFWADHIHHPAAVNTVSH